MVTILKGSSVLRTFSGIVQLVAVIGGATLSLFPAIGAIGITSGLTDRRNHGRDAQRLDTLR